MKRTCAAMLIAAGLIASGYDAEAQVKIRREKPNSVVRREIKLEPPVEQLEESFGSILNAEQSKGKAKIWLSLRNKDGEPIKALKTHQFTVVETINGVSREVPPSDVTLDDQPIATVLLRDVSQSMGRNDLRYSKQALQAFLGKMSPKDKAELIWFSHHVSIMQPMTADKKRLKSALELPFRQGGTALYDSIVFAINRLKKMNEKGFKRAIVIFTDGKDGASSNSLKEVLKFASSSSTPVFTIGVGNADTAVLSQVAKNSRGLYFRASSTSALETIFSSISHILRGSYVLSYETSAVKGDKVEVEITTSLDDAKRVAQFYGTYTAQ